MCIRDSLCSGVIIYKSMININHTTFLINITSSQSGHFSHTKSSSYHYCKDRIPVFIYLSLIHILIGYTVVRRGIRYPFLCLTNTLSVRTTPSIFVANNGQPVMLSLIHISNRCSHIPKKIPKIVPSTVSIIFSLNTYIDISPS